MQPDLLNVPGNFGSYFKFTASADFLNYYLFETYRHLFQIIMLVGEWDWWLKCACCCAKVSGGCYFCYSGNCTMSVWLFIASSVTATCGISIDGGWCQCKFSYSKVLWRSISSLPYMVPKQPYAVLPTQSSCGSMVFNQQQCGQMTLEEFGMYR